MNGIVKLISFLSSSKARSLGCCWKTSRKGKSLFRNLWNLISSCLLMHRRFRKNVLWFVIRKGNNIVCGEVRLDEYPGKCNKLKLRDTLSVFLQKSLWKSWGSSWILSIKLQPKSRTSMLVALYLFSTHFMTQILPRLFASLDFEKFIKICSHLTKWSPFIMPHTSNSKSLTDDILWL